MISQDTVIFINYERITSALFGFDSTGSVGNVVRMTCMNSKSPLTRRQIIELAFASHADEKTVRRYLKGERCYSAVRIRLALVEIGRPDLIREEISVPSIRSMDFEAMS